MPRSSLVRPYFILTSPDNHPIECQDTVWLDELTPASAVRQNPATTKPDFGTFRGNTRAFLFDGGANEGVNFAVQFNHNMKLETDVCAHVHFSPMTVNTGTVIWYLEYTWATINDDFPATSSINATYTIPADEQYKHIFFDIDSIDFSANDGLSSILEGYLYRDAVTDTYADEVALHAIDFHYEMDTLGSRTETTK